MTLFTQKLTSKITKKGSSRKEFQIFFRTFIKVHQIAPFYTTVVLMVCKKDSKINESRIFAQSRQGSWNFFYNIEKLSSFSTREFTYDLSYINSIKTLSLFFNKSIINRPIDFTFLESLFSWFVF